VAQAPAAHVIGVNNFALPGLPSGVEREVIGVGLRRPRLYLLVAGTITMD